MHLTEVNKCSHNCNVYWKANSFSLIIVRKISKYFLHKYLNIVSWRLFRRSSWQHGVFPSNTQNTNWPPNPIEAYPTFQGCRLPYQPLSNGSQPNDTLCCQRTIHYSQKCYWTVGFFINFHKMQRAFEDHKISRKF